MAKPIKMTPEIKAQYLEKVSELLDKYEPTESKLTFTTECNYSEKREARLYFDRVAYQKMGELVTSFDSEIAWHGIGERISENEFYIRDVVVYPQTVTGSNVEMDEVEYGNWILKNIENEDFDNIVLQGHSHVNFQTSPSPTDIHHQEAILADLREDGFYIFLIWNKKGNTFTQIYDKLNNTMYDNKDITYVIQDQEFDREEFLKEAKAMVKPKSYSSHYTYPQTYNNSNKSNNTSLSNKSTEKAKTQVVDKPVTTHNGVKCKPKYSSRVTDENLYDDYM